MGCQMESVPLLTSQRILMTNNSGSKQMIKLVEEAGFIVGQVFDRPRYLPQCHQSGCRGQGTLETIRLYFY
ncbi:hypothetical protein Y032_0006g2930 [Ancylostoma ceylanicum]|uniref:Uncharacterized protein n=1 Tax=Ancylostoma ceylanicum TaxID=53326 RepID=A0A016VPK5_9BILA|nr:hypothetical protein Y032_0006g2930 [Ancylostoma ceylanicum]